MLKRTHAFQKYGRTLLVLALIIGLNPHLVIAIDYVIPSGFSFQKNLKQGDTVDPDVQYLQSILNSRPETKVADTGPGSPTQLTSYFGALTKAAVIKFQELYRSEVLTPAGLASPTGTVGQFTRNKLNALLGKTALVTGLQQSTQTTISPTVGTNDGKGIITAAANTKLLDATTFNRATTTYGMMLYAIPKGATTASGFNMKIGGLFLSGISAYQTRPGLVMSIFGSGFTTEDNNVFIGPVHIGKYTSNTSGTKITFKVPEYMPRGFYQVAVSNKYGTTTSGDEIYLAIDRPKNADLTETRPVVNLITPSYTRYPNDLILINGLNFTLNNTIATNLGDLKNVISTDGKNLTFLVGSLPFFSKAQSEYKGASINLVIKVQNENGTSTDKINHVISFPTDTSAVNQNIQAAALAARNAAILSGARNNATTTSTSTKSSSGGSSSGSKSSSGSSNSSNSSSNIMNYLKPVADPATDLLRQLDPTFKSATDPIFNSDVSQYQTITGGSGKSGGSSSGGSSAAIGGAALGDSSSGGSSSNSSGGSQVDYFGGTITETTMCTCDGTTLITVDDYATNNSVTMLYDPTTSKLNKNFNIWSTGVYVIGGYTSGGGECQVYVGEECETEGTAQYTIDNVRGIGTSTY